MPEVVNSLPVNFSPSKVAPTSPDIAVGDVTKGVSGFDQGLTPYDILTGDTEDVRAHNQSGWSELGNAIPRVLVGTGSQIVKNVGYIKGGIGSILSGGNYLEGAFNDDWAKWADEVYGMDKERFPVYHSNEYNNSTPFQKLFTPTWLAEQGSDMATFMLGTMIPSSMLAKGLSMGMESLAMAPWLAKVGSLGLKSTTIRNTLSTGAAGLFSANLESIQGSQDIYNEALKAKPGDTEYALTRAKDSYIANMAILSFSNIWEINQLTKGLSNVRKAGREFLSATGEAIKPSLKTYIKDAGISALTGMGVEGLWEENIQLAIQNWQKDIINKKTLGTDGAVTSILTNYFNNFSTDEGWENILGGMVMGAVMGGYGGATETHDNYKSALAYSNAFKAGEFLGYKKDDQGNFLYEKNTDGTDKIDDKGNKVKVPNRYKFTIDEFKTAMEKLNKSEDKKDFFRQIELASNLEDNQSGAVLQDFLGSIGLDESYHYTGDVLLAKMAHYYISHGMTDQLKVKLDAIKTSTEEDKLMFSRGLKEDVTLDQHVENQKAKIDKWEKQFNKLEDLYGWQKKDVNIKTEDGNTKKISSPLYDLHGIYLATVGVSSAKEQIANLKVKNLAYEVEITQDVLSRLSTTQEPTVNIQAEIEKSAKDKGSANHDTAKEYIKNQKQLKVLNKTLKTNEEFRGELLDAAKSTERLKKAAAETYKEFEKAVEKFNSGQTQDLTTFNQKVYDYKRKRDAGEGRLFDANNKPGELKTLADGKTYFVHDDGTTEDFEVNDENIDVVLDGYKTKEQIKKEFQDSRQELVLKARIDALEKLINQTHKDQDKIKGRLTKADAATDALQTKLDKLYKDLQDVDKRTKLAKEMKALIVDANQRLERYNQAKTQLIAQKDAINAKLDYLFTELENVKSQRPDEEKAALDVKFATMASQTVEEAQALAALSNMLIDELNVKAETLEDTIRQLEKLIAEHEDLKKFIVFYNKNKVHELEVKYTIPIIRRFITENQDIIPNQLLTGLFTNIQDPKKLINDLNALQEQYNKVHVINSDLYFLNNNLSLSKERLTAVQDTIKSLKEQAAEYKADTDFIERYDMFNKTYGEFQVKFIADFQPYLDKANQEFAELLAPILPEVAESTEFTAMDSQDEERVVDIYTRLSARKNTIFTTSGNTLDGEKGRIQGIVMQQLQNAENKYKLRVINSENEEIRNKYFDDVERAAEDKFRRENPTIPYFPLKVVLVDINTGKSIKRNEEGTINTGNIPVTFYLHVNSFVKNLDPAGSAVEYFNRKAGRDKYSKEFFLAYLDRKHPKHAKYNPEHKNLTLDTGKYFSSIGDLADYVKEQLKQELADFRTSLYNQIKAGKVVHLPILGKSKGIPVITKDDNGNIVSRPVQEALGSASKIAPNGIILASSLAGKRFATKSYTSGHVTLKFVAKNGSIIVVMDDMSYDANIRTALTTPEEAQLIIDLLAHAYGNVEKIDDNGKKIMVPNSEHTIRDTEGKLHYIRSKGKVAKSAPATLIDQLIVWGGMKGKYQKYQIFLDSTTGHIKYGLNPQTKKPYYIRLADIGKSELNEHFKSFLQTKYFNVSNKLLLKDKKSVYLQPVGVERVEDENGSSLVLKTLEWKPMTNNSGYVTFLTNQKKLLSNLPPKGQVQAHNMYLVYDEKNPEITDAPVKEEKKVENKTPAGPVSDKKVEIKTTSPTNESFNWLIESDRNLPHNGSIVFTRTSTDGKQLEYKGNLTSGIWIFGEATKDGKPFTPGDSVENLNVFFNSVIDEFRGENGSPTEGITSMMVSPNEYSNQTEVRQSVQPNVQVKKADIERARQEELTELGQKQLTKGFNSLSEATKPEQVANAIVNIEQNKNQGALLSKEQEQTLSEAKAKLKEQGHEIVDYNIVRSGENTIVQGVDFYDNQKDVLTEEQANAIESRINSLEKRGEEVNVDDLPSPVSRTIKPLIKKDGKMVQKAEVNTLIFESVEQAKEAIIKSREAGNKKPNAADKVNAEYDAKLAALESKPTEDNSPIKSLDAVLEGAKQAIKTNEQILEIARKIQAKEEVTQADKDAAWAYFETLKPSKSLRASRTETPNDIDTNIREILKTCIKPS